MHYLLKEVFYIYETRTYTDYIKYCFMKKIAIFLIGLAAAWLLPAKGQIVSENDTLPQGVYSDEQISEILRNMPNIEVGKGLTFKTKDDKYKLTLRLRMQSLAGSLGIVLAVPITALVAVELIYRKPKKAGNADGSGVDREDEQMGIC